jgi:hypothetical protein
MSWVSIFNLGKNHRRFVVVHLVYCADVQIMTQWTHYLLDLAKDNDHKTTTTNTPPPLDVCVCL